MSPVHFTTGLSDFFASLANGGTPFGNDSTQINQMFDRILDYNARTIRVTVYWGRVETSPGVFDWSHYQPVIDRAAERNLRILPVVWDAPPNNQAQWGFPTNQVIKPNGSPGVWYPYTQPGYGAYGNFVAEALSHFGSAGVSRAVEVWNEPNSLAYLGANADYPKILNAALVATNARTYPFPYTVISGGLAQNNSNWKSFMDDFVYYNQCFTPYSVGIHPYAYKQAEFPDTMSRADAVALFVDKVKTHFDDAKNRWNGDLWITEFGCPTIAPFGRIGRSDALEQLVGQNGFLEGRARCKGVILYRLLPQEFIHDDATPDFATIPLLNLTSSNPFTFSEEQPVQGMLNANWAGAGFYP